MGNSAKLLAQSSYFHFYQVHGVHKKFSFKNSLQFHILRSMLPPTQNLIKKIDFPVIIIF